jgi:hypothetical protein
MSKIKIIIQTLSMEYLVKQKMKFLLFLVFLSSISFTTESMAIKNTANPEMAGKNGIRKTKVKKIPGISRVWAIDDGEKIKQEDISNPLANSPQNTLWDGKTVKLFGAKNEIVAFQLIIQADNSDVKNINVKLNELASGQFSISNSRAKGVDPFDYTGKHIELFTEHYMNLTKPTEPKWFYHPNAKPSDYYLGWVPDALIPFEAPSGKGGAPFDIAANKNQGVWIDIFIPSDAVAGLYKGTIQLTDGNKNILEIPIELKVCKFALPDEYHAHNMFFIDPPQIAKAHGVIIQSNEYYAIETKYRQMAHRHRMDNVSNVKSLDEMEIFHKKYLTGEMFTPANKYEGPGEGVGNRTFSIGVYGSLPSEYKWSGEGWWKGSDAWEEWFIRNAPLVERHKYLRPDEPVYWNKGKGGIDTIKVQGRWNQTNPGPGKNIPGLVTAHILPELRGYVDFWSIPAQFSVKPTTSVADLNSEISSGKKWGFYNGFRPSAGAVIIDADAIEFRVQPWIMWKYNADQYFYWETTHWTGEMFGNSESIDKAMGDGTMFYPGQSKQFPDQDRGLAGPFSSIRMKNWRRGAQDYEYLWLLKKAGAGAKAKAISDSCIPQALWEADTSKNISWSGHGFAFEKFRKQMASLLDSLSTDTNK